MQKDTQFSFNPSSRGFNTVFGELETNVMEEIWKAPEITIRDVHNRLPKSKSLAYTTVATVMNRLVDKGVLRKSSSGNTQLYSAKVSKDKFAEGFIQKIFKSLFSEFSKPALNQFVDTIAEDPKKLDELQKLIDQKRGV